MTVITDRTKAILDNLKGSAFSIARAIEIVEDFNNSIEGTGDEKALLFMESLVNHIKKTVRNNAIGTSASGHAAADVQAGEDAVIDL